MIEPSDRSLKLRDLEAQYFGLLIRTPELEQHLGKESETVTYTGACRALTNRISESRAAVLAVLPAMGISGAIDREAGCNNRLVVGHFWGCDNVFAGNRAGNTLAGGGMGNYD